MKRRSEGKRFSPHSDMLELLGFHSVFPASAGMIPRPKHWTRAIRSVPRKRGDDPQDYMRAQMSVPVFPASAGMIPVIHEFEDLTPGVPRKRGDDPPSWSSSMTRRMCSPQARG